MNKKAGMKEKDKEQRHPIDRPRALSQKVMAHPTLGIC